MADSASESNSSSIDGGPKMMPPSPVTREQLQKRNESLQQQNRVLKVELKTYKRRVKALQEENRGQSKRKSNKKRNSSNTLLKKIQALKKEKETLAQHYERREECVINDLSRKLTQLQKKCRLEQDQECQVNRLIEKLEAEMLAKQRTLEQLRREKVELENFLEQEQEALVNKLWKRVDKLEAEERNELDQPTQKVMQYTGSVKPRAPVIQQQPPPPNSQTYLDDSSSSSSSSMSDDEYRDSARMLICLENGEQRMLTFNLPKESCTVQDLLEQVGVPFNSDTKIECILNPGNEIDYIVNVGTVKNSAFAAASMDGQKPIKCDEEDGSDRDEAEGDESELEDLENDSDQID